MNNQATLEKMNQLRLYGMHRAFSEALSTGLTRDFTVDEMIAQLIQSEWDDRYNRKLERLVRSAKFRYQARVEELDFSPSRNLDKNMILRLSSCEWIGRGENLIVTGATGAGKSFVTTALGYSACSHGFKVMYSNCLKLFAELKFSQADGTYIRKMKAMQRMDLLILDDFGLKKLDSQSRLILLEILEDRYAGKSVIISTQLPVSEWFEVIGDQTIADAICDRLVHNSHRIELKGDSMRKKKQKHS